MLSEKPWTLEATLRLLLWIFICIFFILLVVGLLEKRMGPLPDNSPFSAAVGILAMDGPILLMVCLFLLWEQISWGRAFGLNTPPVARVLILGLFAALVFLPLGLMLQYVSQLALDAIRVKTHEQQAIQILRNAEPGWGRVVFSFAAVVIAPVAEETLFRGILYPAIKQHGFPRTALWGTSLFFALIHLHAPSFISLTVLAMLLVWLYEKTDNLLACILAHSAFNAMNVVMVYQGENIIDHLDNLWRRVAG